jgi:hypothetical protein
MGELADDLASFLGAMVDMGVSWSLLTQHVRWATWERSTIRGSPLGAELWARPEGRRLWELVANDEGVLAAYCGELDLEQPTDGIRRAAAADCRAMVASAIERWPESGQSARQYSDAIEATLWACLVQDQATTFGMARWGS